MKYNFIKDNLGRYKVDEVCEALGVKGNSYYSWRSRGVSAHSIEDDRLKGAIAKVYKEARGRYGHLPIYYHLQDESTACGRDRTLRLMKEMGINNTQKKRFKPLCTDSNHAFSYSANLLKKLGKPTAVDGTWVADTTYLPTENGWRYLATVMDLFSRRIIGWSVSAINDAELTCNALKAAVITRSEVPIGVVHHSDRGSTYASDKYQSLLFTLRMNPSMSAKGNCYDNAAMESFYGRYKCSSVRNHVFANESELRANVFDYIEVFYNRFRKHSSLGYKSPMQFESEIFSPMGEKQEQACLLSN